MKLYQGFLFTVLFVQWAYTAPSEVALESITEPKNDDIDQKDDPEVTKPETLLDEKNDSQEMQGQRQKRWYNFYGFPPVNPVVQYKRDDYTNSGAYGLEDPLGQIHRRLQELSGFIRQPQPVPPLPPQAFPPQFPPQFPPFIPVLYIPQIGCSCTPADTPNRPENRPATPQDNNQTTDNPGVNNRWPEMEDERQNWGFVINDTDTNDNNEADINDGARPISFQPIRPNRTMSRPPPPVEHGSVQGDINSLTVTTTTVRPQQAPTTSRLSPPSTCDAAVLSCCHMPQVTYDCFAVQGCTDPYSYGNPCDPSVIARVIDRFRIFYNQRSG
ncbi:unnamed protein product [Diatraea saccharalis]|uniref:Uncharacterized protein n=1 Tax=Diatraea saccharalis TaxID=40085 RepID=A0A9N9RFL8_9NEOP|nr:unnamed protein product [Diatraea saccharalis]